MSSTFRALYVAGVFLCAGGTVVGSSQPAAAAGYYQCAQFEKGSSLSNVCSGKDNGNHKGGAAWIAAYISAHAGWSVRGKPFIQTKNPCKQYTCWNPAAKMKMKM